ncbi:MAG TPA: TolC family protein, partial [Acetobacteraceae bacterium]|nr:TolC family protein [Acetobacteraceae bacterium]
MARAAIMAAGLAASLCGCAHDKPAPLSAAANAQALESRSLRDPRLLTFVQAALARHDSASSRHAWDLARLTLAALYFHPDIPIAQARLAAAKAAELTARERPNPVLNLTNIIDQAAVPGALPAAAAAITIGPVIDFVVETAGKRAARTARARHLAEAAGWDLTTAEWQVRSRVRNALLDLWAARQRLARSRQQQALQQALVQLLQIRLSAGEASAPELDRERIRYARIIVKRSDLR